MSKSIDPLRTTTLELHSKKTIILVGDSWACGEWANRNITHRGLEQYLTDDGYTVINCGEGGGSNSLSYLRLLEAIWQNQIDKKNTKVFFFWSDWHRDLYRPFDIIDFRNLAKRHVDNAWLLETFDEQTPHRFFHRILEKLQRIDLPIGLIGGCTDVIKVDDTYTPVYTACQSFVNLCLCDDDSIDNPIYSIFTNIDFGNQHLRSSPCFLDDMEKANTRRLQLKENREWFWPDGLHANRHAHLKLYNFLKSQDYL